MQAGALQAVEGGGLVHPDHADLEVLRSGRARVAVPQPLHRPLQQRRVGGIGPAQLGEHVGAIGQPAAAGLQAQAGEHAALVADEEGQGIVRVGRQDPHAGGARIIGLAEVLVETVEQLRAGLADALDLLLQAEGDQVAVGQLRGIPADQCRIEDFFLGGRLGGQRASQAETGQQRSVARDG